MTRLEMLNAIGDKKEKMRSLVDTAKKENRELNEKEQNEFRNLEVEAQMLEFEVRSMFDVPKVQNSETPQRRFAKMVSEVRDKKQPIEVDMRSILSETVPHDASTPIIYQDLIKPLEKGFVLDKVGCKILYNVHGEPLYPSVSGSEASVEGENDEVAESSLEFGTIKSTPKRISMAYAVSNRAINQSNLNLYGLIMESLGMGVARKLNKILCDTTAHGSFSGPFVGLESDQVVSHSAGTAYTYKDIVSIEHLVLDKMVDAMSGNSCYLMNTKTAALLKSTPIEKGNAKMILEMFYDPTTNYRWGVMNGYRVEFCNYVADGKIMFGDFRHLGVPQFGELSIIVDPYTLAKKNATLFVLNTEMDMTRLRKEAFAMSEEA